MKFPTLTTVVMFLHSAAAWILGRAGYTCYSSYSSKAKNIRTVYDDYKLSGEFWYWDNSLLVPCNFSSIYSSSSKCSVCIDDSVRPETVIVVFSNLSSSVQPVFEGPETELRFNQTDCPPTEPIGTTTGSRPPKANNEGGWTDLNNALLCIAAVIIIIIIIIIVVVIYLVYKRKPKQTAGNEPNNVSYKPVSDSVQIDMNGNGNVGPPAE